MLILRAYKIALMSYLVPFSKSKLKKNYFYFLKKNRNLSLEPIISKLNNSDFII